MTERAVTAALFAYSSEMNRIRPGQGAPNTHEDCMRAAINAAIAEGEEKMKVEPVIQITSANGTTTISANIKFEDFATSMELLNLLVAFLKEKRGYDEPRRREADHQS